MLFTEIEKSGTSCHTSYSSRLNIYWVWFGKHQNLRIFLSVEYTKLLNISIIAQEKKIIERMLEAGHVVTLTVVATIRTCCLLTQIWE